MPKATVADEGILHECALRGIEARVIGQRSQAEARQILRRRLRRRTRQRVHDAALSAPGEAQPSYRLLDPDAPTSVLALLEHVDVQVGSEEGAPKLDRVDQP